MNVLIVDDEKIITNSLKMILADTGLFNQILIADDGIDACRKIDNQKFVLVIIDINMPKKDGLSVVKYIRENKINSEIMLISGGLNEEKVQIASDFRIKHVLAKPFNAKKFMAKLELVIQDLKRSGKFAA